MSQKKAKGKKAEIQAKDLLVQLDRLYSDYLEKYQQQEKSKSKVAKLFGKWFASFEPTLSDSMHQEFLAGIERVIKELAMTLNSLKQENLQLCHSIAGKAVSRLMMPKPANEKTTAEWYMTVAEYQCFPLLPYLSREDLKHFHDLMLKRVPKRMMYPRQRQLVAQMEELLNVKE